MCILLLLLSVKRPRSLWNFFMFNTHTHTQDNRAAISLSTTSRCVCLSIPFGYMGNDGDHRRWQGKRRNTNETAQEEEQQEPKTECKVSVEGHVRAMSKGVYEERETYSASNKKRKEKKKVSGWLLRSNAGAPFFYMCQWICLISGSRSSGFFWEGRRDSRRILRRWKCVDDLLLHFQCVWWRPR